MKILRYDERVQQQLKSKTKPEPWLHIALADSNDRSYVFAIYIWDTREVIETGTTDNVTMYSLDGNIAKDNHTMIKGGNSKDIVARINNAFMLSSMSVSEMQTYRYMQRMLTTDSLNDHEKKEIRGLIKRYSNSKNDLLRTSARALATKLH